MTSAMPGARCAVFVSAVAVLSLALGIDTATFSIVDTLILRTLPVPHARRLALVSQAKDFSSLTNPIWESLRDRGSLFDGSFACGFGTRQSCAQRRGRSRRW